MDPLFQKIRTLNFVKPEPNQTGTPVLASVSTLPEIISPSPTTHPEIVHPQAASPEVSSVLPCVLKLFQFQFSQFVRLLKQRLFPHLPRSHIKMI
jgi:hypothetical protein